MSKSTKSRDRSANNGKPIDGEFDLLTPEQWVQFAETFRLSERELEVLILTSRNMPRKAIAGELHIAFDTVNTFCDRLHKKTRVTDRLALVRRLVEFVRSVPPT